MADALSALETFLNTMHARARIVVWAHNSHVGGARATQMGESDELNIGQLTRQQYGRDAVLFGFTTYTGTVTAASNRDAPAERKVVRPALAGSYEALLHDAGPRNFLSTRVSLQRP